MMAHIHEKIDFTSSVYVVFKDKVLLHRHKKYPLWLPPGGHIELDEDPNQAAVREVKEEAGLDIELIGHRKMEGTGDDKKRDLIPPKFVNRHFVDESRKHEHVDFIYFGKTQGNEVRPEGDEQFVWLSREDIERNELGISSDIKAYALEALKELSS